MKACIAEVLYLCCGGTQNFTIKSQKHDQQSWKF